VVGSIGIVGIRSAVGEHDDHIRRARPRVGCQNILGHVDRISIVGVASRLESVHALYEVGVRIKRTRVGVAVVDKLIDQQSAEADREKRKQLVWEIERRLAEDGARPIIFYPRGGTCTQPYV
jgi:hypothetical protein